MPSGPAQFIRIVGDDDGQQVIRNSILEPDYPWPPPEILYVVHGHILPEESFQYWLSLDPADEIAEFIQQVIDEGARMPPPAYTVTAMRRQTYSKLDDEQVTDSFVARGAEYQPVKGILE